MRAVVSIMTLMTSLAGIISSAFPSKPWSLRWDQKFANGAHEASIDAWTFEKFSSLQSGWSCPRALLISESSLGTFVAGISGLGHSFAISNRLFLGMHLRKVVFRNNLTCSARLEAGADV